MVTVYRGGEVDPRRPPGSGSMRLQGSPWKPIWIEADPRGYTGGGDGVCVRGGGGAGIKASAGGQRSTGLAKKEGTLEAPL